MLNGLLRPVFVEDVDECPGLRWRRAENACLPDYTFLRPIIGKGRMLRQLLHHNTFVIIFSNAFLQSWLQLELSLGEVGVRLRLPAFRW